MIKDQLFKVYPTSGLIRQLLCAFGLNGLDDNTSFSRLDLLHRGSVSKLIKLKPELEKCYIPCKARTYLNSLSEKNIITILRQVLKHIGYTVFSKEKYSSGYKFMLYHVGKIDPWTNIIVASVITIKKLHTNPQEPKIKEQKPIIITFD